MRADEILTVNKKKEEQQKSEEQKKVIRIKETVFFPHFTSARNRNCLKYSIYGECHCSISIQSADR